MNMLDSEVTHVNVSEQRLKPVYFGNLEFNSANSKNFLWKVLSMQKPLVNAKKYTWYFVSHQYVHSVIKMIELAVQMPVSDSNKA